MNSVIGISESLGKFRIFTFDPEWAVLHEEYFRASALRGHPLANAAFTSFALFIALGLRWPTIVKTLFAAVFVTSLVAFGGRASLAISVFGLVLLGIIRIVRMIASRNLSLLQALLAVAAVLVAPVCVFGGLYMAIHSGMGERLAASAHWDQSADVRELAPLALQYMTDEELVFGASSTRIVEIGERINQKYPLAIIENPWILMFMNLGGVFFVFWLAATLLFVRQLLEGRPLPHKLAVLGYFAIASTFNSFGTKDQMYPIMVSVTVCAARAVIPARRTAGYTG